MKKILFLSVIIFTFCGCFQSNHKVNEKELSKGALLDPDPLCLKKKRLMETILNHPEFIKYSRLQNVKKVFDTIYIVFSKNTFKCILPPYVQQGDTLKVVYNNDSLDTVETPVYELTEMEIKDDSAYVLLKFDISGAIAYGNLKYINEQWVPDSNFVIGVR